MPALGLYPVLPFTPMSERSRWRLREIYDDSDPEAKISEEELLKLLDIRKESLYAQLPAKKFPRKEGFIMGVKLREIPVVGLKCEDLFSAEESVGGQSEVVYSEPPPPSDETLFQAKESARFANNKVAEMYKTIDQSRAFYMNKREAFSDLFKKSIWRNKNGGLHHVFCPVCSQNIISEESFSAGHILPLAKGGLMCIENILPICSDCNSRMSDRHLFWFAWHYYGKVLWSVY